MRKLIKAWKQRLYPPPPKIRVMVRDQTRITLDEWRSRPDLIKIASRFLNDPMFRMMMDVLRTTHFQNSAMGIFGVSIEDRAAMQARCEGYTIALNNLEAMGDYQKPKQELEPTFEPEEETETEPEETT